MPNKYSHSVVLAHYSSLGLIDLPNDQYIAYLKTYPNTPRSSTTTRSKEHTNGTSGSVTPSTSYSARYKNPGDNASTSKSVTSRREYGGTARRDVIVESDEGSGDEHVVVGKRYEPYESASQSQSQSEVRGLRAERRKLPSVSAYTGRSSSEASEGVIPSEPPLPPPLPPLPPPQAFSSVRGESKRSPPSVINLNDYELMSTAEASEATPYQNSGPDTEHSSSRKPSHLAARAIIPANSKTPLSMTRDTEMYHPDPEGEPDFAGFSDAHYSDATITGLDNADTDTSSTVPRSQISKSSTFNQHAPLTNGLVSLPQRLDSATGFNQKSAKLRQPRKNRSFDSISSMDSEMMHSTTALPPVVPRKAQKPLHESGKNSVSSGDPLDSDDAMDPSLFDIRRNGSRQASMSPSTKRFAGFYSNSPPLTSRPSQQSTQKSGDQSLPSPDFWRGLDEMLSDSDASVVFPPDIAKYKPRDNVPVHVLKPSRTPIDHTKDGELRRPTTSTAPKTGNSDAFTSNEPLPVSRSKITVNNKGSLGKPNDAGKMTTVQLVDTSSLKEKNGFLRKLRKKTYDQKKP